MGESDKNNLLQFLNEASIIMMRILEQPNQATSPTIQPNRFLQNQLFESPNHLEMRGTKESDRIYWKSPGYKKDSINRSEVNIDEAFGSYSGSAKKSEDKNRNIVVIAKRNDILMTDSSPQAMRRIDTGQEESKWKMKNRDKLNYFKNKNMEKDRIAVKRKLLQEECEEALKSSSRVINTVHTEDYADIANMSFQTMLSYGHQLSDHLGKGFPNNHSRRKYEWNPHNQQNQPFDSLTKKQKQGWPRVEQQPQSHQLEVQRTSSNLPSDPGDPALADQERFSLDGQAPDALTNYYAAPESSLIPQIESSMEFPVVSPSRTEDAVQCVQGATSLYPSPPSSTTTGGSMEDRFSEHFAPKQPPLDVVLPVTTQGNAHLSQNEAVLQCYFGEAPLVNDVQISSPSHTEESKILEIPGNAFRLQDDDQFFGCNESILDDIDWFLSNEMDTSVC
ncbi:hypothetical protein CAPTEDRAFT_215374 [Capitella teleta]|uniref:Uncharacterized protein n=1 Tax=Capitella teleta TaxID=283909 RepID=R7V5C9_CAPTE|nr:hypothetical protein CAPTEDRAFT_215374 [Capitella teleta]|eukprot:ELU11561.1 hypothetical protein CAPTEDRAFT_215374 [Capitella teleta]